MPPNFLTRFVGKRQEISAAPDASWPVRRFGYTLRRFLKKESTFEQ